MAHRHSYGELVTEFYVSVINSDPTEGRGSSIDKGIFENADDAYEDCVRADVQGTDGDVYYRTFSRCEGCPQLIKTDKKIYSGSKWGRDANFLSDGWRADFSPLAKDPEFKDYLRLKKKFKGLE